MENLFLYELLLAGFSAGCLIVAFLLVQKARKELKRCLLITERALEGIEKGHLLKVIIKESEHTEEVEF